MMAIYTYLSDRNPLTVAGAPDAIRGTSYKYSPLSR